MEELWVSHFRSHTSRRERRDPRYDETVTYVVGAQAIRSPTAAAGLQTPPPRLLLPLLSALTAGGEHSSAFLRRSGDAYAQ